MDSSQPIRFPRKWSITHIHPNDWHHSSELLSRTHSIHTKPFLQSRQKTIALASSNHPNSIIPIHSIISSFCNAHQIPRQFHVSTFQACNCLHSCNSYRFHIGSWNDYSMEYFRTLPNSSAYVTDCCQSSSFSRGTVCIVWTDQPKHEGSCQRSRRRNAMGHVRSCVDRWKRLISASTVRWPMQNSFRSCGFRHSSFHHT